MKKWLVIDTNIEFHRSDIEPGGVAIITSNPNRIFRGQKFVVPTKVARHFTINWISVGNQHQIGPIPVPALTFAPRRKHSNIFFRVLYFLFWPTSSSYEDPPEVLFETSEMGNQINVEVVNHSNRKRSFRATLSGVSTSR